MLLINLRINKPLVWSALFFLDMAAAINCEVSFNCCLLITLGLANPCGMFWNPEIKFRLTISFPDKPSQTCAYFCTLLDEVWQPFQSAALGTPRHRISDDVCGRYGVVWRDGLVCWFVGRCRNLSYNRRRSLN